jgi:hypothetical protein
VPDVTVTVDDGERQMLLLALAKLSIERPGWKWTLGELAAAFSTAPNIEDGREMFERFRAIHEASNVDALVAAVRALDPAAADSKPYDDWDAAKWAVFNAAVRFVKEQP